MFALLVLLPGCTHLDRSDDFLARWAMRGAGAVGAFALHEACHVATGKAFGAEVDGSWRGSGPYLEFSGLTPKQHQTVSIMGNACTGIAAELIVDTGRHKKSNFAWGAAAFHAFNAFGYAFSHEGDAEYWEDSGGTRESWQLINAGHATRIGAHLAWDSEPGMWLRKRWRIAPAPTAPFLAEGDALLGESSETSSVFFDGPVDPAEATLAPVLLPASLDPLGL